MTKVRDVIFFDEIEEIEIPNNGVLQLQVRSAPERASPADVKVRWREKEAEVPRLATHRQVEVGADRAREILPAMVCVLFEDSDVVLLIGEFSVYSIALGDWGVEELAPLFRTPEKYDLGFRKQQVLPLQDGVLLVYEQGAARVDRDGRLRWHQRLFADDLFERRDDEYLYYWSEAEGRTAIALDDGRRVRLHTSGHDG